MVGEATSVLSVLLDENRKEVMEPPEFRLRMRSGLGVISSWSEVNGLHVCSLPAISSISLVNVKERWISTLSDVDVVATGQCDATARWMVQSARCKVEGGKVRASATNLSACELLEFDG